MGQVGNGSCVMKRIRKAGAKAIPLTIIIGADGAHAEAVASASAASVRLISTLMTWAVFTTRFGVTSYSLLKK